jgi:cell division protease FtsH
MVTSIARRMITQYGMSAELGLVAYDSDQPVFMGMEYGHSERVYSQETAAKIDAEVRRITSEGYERALNLLRENRTILDNMSRVLVEKETIYKEDIALLMKGADYKEVIAAIEARDGERESNPFKSVEESATETTATETEETTVETQDKTEE